MFFQVDVRGLPGWPIAITLPVRRLADKGNSLTSTAACPVTGRSSVLQVSCAYAGGLNASVNVRCDGSQASVAITCPAVPRCAFWNMTQDRWAHDGCKAVGLTLWGGRETVRCQCNHLTTFSATIDTLQAIGVSTLRMDDRDETAEADGMHVLFLVVGSIYLAFSVALLLSRHRGPREDEAYLRCVCLGRHAFV